MLFCQCKYNEKNGFLFYRFDGQLSNTVQANANENE
jgi:hypothetical protein